METRVCIYMCMRDGWEGKGSLYILNSKKTVLWRAHIASHDTLNFTQCSLYV